MGGPGRAGHGMGEMRFPSGSLGDATYDLPPCIWANHLVQWGRRADKGIVPKARNSWEGMAMTNSWSALKEVRANARKDDGQDYFIKAMQFVEDGKRAGDMGHYDFEAARRHMGYALYQIERLFNLRNGRG